VVSESQFHIFNFAFFIISMSYHILHQFDEQWLNDLQEETIESERKGLLKSFEEKHPQVHRARLAARESKRWAIVAASVLLAGIALIFSLEANRRADSLQRRLDALETAVKK
jgi:hypothetical protein